MISTRPLGVSRSIPPWDLSFPFPHMKNSLRSTVPGQSKKHLGWIKPDMDRTVCLDLFFMMNFTYFVFLYISVCLSLRGKGGKCNAANKLAVSPP